MTRSQRREAPIVYVREASEAWSRERFREVVAAPVDEAALAPVEARRRMLARVVASPLPAVYGGARRVSAAEISIPKLYGHILYALVAELRPRVALEAGAGFGLSGMYLGAAMAAVEDSVLFSFELGEHVDHARDSIARVFSRAFVIRDDATNFARHVPAATQFDFAFLDAVHDYETILGQTKLLRGWLSPGASILIDDVLQTADGRRAWREIATAHDVRFAALIRERLGFVSWR